MIFEQSFDLPEDIDLESVRVRFRFIADDNVTIMLNGQAVAGPYTFESDPNDLKRWRTFTPVMVDSGFKTGRNVIAFHVTNALRSPMGLRVEFDSVSAQRRFTITHSSRSGSDPADGQP